MVTDPAWWKESVVYQVYPRSFKDADGDGVGDLPGIVEKADYIADLGVDVVWLSPVYDSPNEDNGYDIRDYRAIMDEMGTMADWERLRDALHDRGVKLVMDLVVNHTSDEHDWFQRSRRREDGYEDYYIWRDGDPDGDPPNNWESHFGGSAWSYDETRGQYYLHLYSEKQPDLNWTNPDVRADVKDLIEWWLERDIDGFRMDVINVLSKTEGLPDGDPDSEWIGMEHFVDGPRIHEHLRELYDDVFSRYDVMTVAEMPKLTVDAANDYLGEDGDGLDMAFHFDHTSLDFGEEGRWDVGDWSLTDLKEVLARWQTGLDGNAWDAVFLNNHDQPRSVSRFGDDAYREESATMLATLLMTVRGTPYIYQGEEIGMTNADFRHIDECRDVDTINYVNIKLERGEAESFEDVRDVVNYRTRDNARTPMQWSADEHAGFTDGEPWIKVNDNHTDINVEAALADENSILQYYRDLISLRHREDVLVYGDYEQLLPADEEVFAHTRTLGDDRVLVVLNWTDRRTELDLRDAAAADEGSVLLANYDDPGSDLGALDLRPYEARVYWL